MVQEATWDERCPLLREEIGLNELLLLVLEGMLMSFSCCACWWSEIQVGGVWRGSFQHIFVK